MEQDDSKNIEATTAALREAWKTLKRNGMDAAAKDVAGVVLDIEMASGVNGVAVGGACVAVPAVAEAAAPAAGAGLACAPSPAVFNFGEHRVRTFVDGKGEPWFVANDVCEILGYVNTSQAVIKNCREGGISKREVTCDLSKREATSKARETQEMTLINEGNLYRLIIKSRKPEAEPFEVWVCDEVLPAIRRTGRYEMGAPAKPQQQPTELLPLNIETLLCLRYAFNNEAGACNTLWTLLCMGAGSDWITPSVREVSAASGGLVSKSNVARCAILLKQRGLIDLRTNLTYTATAYLVLEDAVVAMLRETGKQLAGLPGVNTGGGAQLPGGGLVH